MDAFFDIFQKPHYVLKQSDNECTGKIANKLPILALNFLFWIFWEQGNWTKIILSGKLLFIYFTFLWQTLSHCELITDEGIRHIGHSACATEQLRILELDNCPLITDASLDYLTGCQNLERIELYDCQLITKAAIRRLRVSRLCCHGNPSHNRGCHWPTVLYHQFYNIQQQFR